MKVYVVFNEDEYGLCTDMDAIFSSKKNALAYCKYMGYSKKVEHSIMEYEIDEGMKDFE